MPSANESLPIQDDIDPRDIQFFEDRLYEYNTAQTGQTDGRQLAIILRDAQNAIIAGLYGWTWGGTCEIRTLWVSEAQRGQGLGTRLMAAAEAEARTRGVAQIVLSTHSFQAPDFYRRLGFEQIGVIENHPQGYQQFIMRKRLA